MSFISAKRIVALVSLFALIVSPLQTLTANAGGWFEGDIQTINDVSYSRSTPDPRVSTIPYSGTDAVPEDTAANVSDSLPLQANISTFWGIDMCNSMGWWIWLVVGALLLFSFAHFVWPTEDKDRARRTALSLFMLLLAFTLMGMHLCLLNSWLNTLILAVAIYLLLKITSRTKKEPTP